MRFPLTVRDRSLSAFFRTFAVMIAAGVPMQRVLDVQIAQCSDRRFREALRSVLAEIQNGRSLSAALRTRPRDFGALHVAMIEAGESGGMLDTVLDRLASMLERSQALRRRVLASLSYPAIVFVAAVLLVVFLMTTIVPAFSRMFAQLNIPLPPITRVLLAAGDSAGRTGTALLALAVAGGTAGLIAVRTRKRSVLAAADRIRLGVPLAGAIVRRSIEVRVLRVLGSLLRSGVDILRAVEITATVTGSVSYTGALRSMTTTLREGGSFSETLDQMRVFGPFVVQMIRVGEESGSLDTMMFRVADHYEAEIEAAGSALGATVEPILICIAGLAIAGIVFSIFIPLYSFVGQIH